MNPMAIQVEHLGKRYCIGERQAAYGTLRDTLVHAIQKPLRVLRARDSDNERAEIWALRDISFCVRAGEVLGIIGRNGAGKSTLLKVLSRVTRPTVGRAWIRGQVGSLLEVGTGFHPELSGRENIYLNGAVLGMPKAEIDRKFDEIVAFAETERFLDTPVKHYSSGMYMRLAFAVAAHLEPEILIVDEVLAVGDAAFQKKCLSKMGSVAQEGRTVLFVSHNLIAIQSLCNRVIWLQQGQVRAEGQPGLVVAQYLQTSFATLTEQVWPDRSSAPGNEQVRLRRVCVRPAAGQSSDPITRRTPIVLEFEFWNGAAGAHLELNFQLMTNHGLIAFASSPSDQVGWHDPPLPLGLFRSQCHIPGDLLMAGQYRIVLSVIKDESSIIYHQEEALIFEVQDSPELRGSWYGDLVGVVRPLLPWTTELLEGDASIATRRESQDAHVLEPV